MKRNELQLIQLMGQLAGDINDIEDSHHQAKDHYSEEMNNLSSYKQLLRNQAQNLAHQARRVNMSSAHPQHYQHPQHYPMPKPVQQPMPVYDVYEDAEPQPVQLTLPLDFGNNQQQVIEPSIKKIELSDEDRKFFATHVEILSSISAKLDSISESINSAAVLIANAVMNSAPEVEEFDTDEVSLEEIEIETEKQEMN